MDGKYIKENFPKTLDKIVEWVKSTHKASGIPDVDQSIAELKPDAIIAMLVLGSPRFLYDYFDSVGIYVTPYPFHGYEKIIWYPSIDGGEIQKEINEDMEGVVHIAHSREEAEKISFIEAFKIAEND